jgi:spore germination cell wall hydrolase CwlJ-like protein
MIRWLVGMLLMVACSRLASLPAPLAPLYDDNICLAWVVDDEARGEPPRGQRAVYDVVKHRMVVRRKTACEVVMERKQFSGYKPGMHLYVNDLMLDRLSRIQKMRPVVPKADYFHATYVKPSWAALMKQKLKIGLHVFYEVNHPSREGLPKEKQK